ncbi:MAG: Fe-S protein assembly co-chaperone HscB [Gammaproteobacteria bacterium]
MQNYFELFQLAPTYEIEITRLKLRYYELQQQFHPDQYQEAAEKRQASQLSAYINDAYQTLQCGIKRATYLLSLNGIQLNQTQTVTLSPEFLMEQMAFRERLVECKSDKASLRAFLEDMTQCILRNERKLSSLFEAWSENIDNIKNLINEMQFYQKLKSESERFLWDC